MKNTKKIVALVLAIVLVCAASVMGTLAYLNSTTVIATNTFTVGDVKITLDEAKVNEYGVAIGTDRVTGNTYKLIPGHTYTKDPTIHVQKGSEECYVFVKVENGLADIEAGTTIAQQMEKNDWTKLTGVDGVENVYYYQRTVDARSDAIDLPVFGEFTINSALDAEDLSNYGGANITVTGYAIQADGFENVNAAAAAVPGLKTSTNS